MLDAHFVKVHVILVRVLVILKLHFKAVEGVLEDSAALRVRLLVDTVILLRFDIVAIKNVLYCSGSGEAAEGRLCTAAGEDLPVRTDRRLLI